MVIDALVFVEVEEAEGFVDFFALLFCQLRHGVGFLAVALAGETLGFAGFAGLGGGGGGEGGAFGEFGEVGVVGALGEGGVRGGGCHGLVVEKVGVENGGGGRVKYGVKEWGLLVLWKMAGLPCLIRYLR